MHPQVRQPGPGACPVCNMALVPEGARFALLRHLASRPLHLVIMLAATVAVVAAAMMMMR